MKNLKKQGLRRQLEEQKMFNVIELIEEGADNEVIVKTFEDSVLSASSRYQKWMKTLQSIQKNERDNNELGLIMEKLKQRSLRRPEYRKVYRLLKQL